MSHLVLGVSNIRQARTVWLQLVLLVLYGHLSVLNCIIVLSKGLFQVFDVGLQDSLLMLANLELVDLLALILAKFLRSILSRAF